MKTKNIFKRILVILGIIIPICIGTVSYFNLMRIDCSNDLSKKIEKDKYIVEMFIRNCGATTDYSTILKINDREFFIIKGDLSKEINISFKENFLNINCKNCKKNDIFLQEKSFNNFKIKYQISAKEII